MSEASLLFVRSIGQLLTSREFGSKHHYLISKISYYLLNLCEELYASSSEISQNNRQLLWEVLRPGNNRSDMNMKFVVSWSSSLQ